MNIWSKVFLQLHFNTQLNKFCPILSHSMSLSVFISCVWRKTSQESGSVCVIPFPFVTSTDAMPPVRAPFPSPSSWEWEKMIKHILNILFLFISSIDF